MDSRPEGVYCKWEGVGVGTSLVLERVNGDGSVETFSCSQKEAEVVAVFLDGSEFMQRVKKFAGEEG
jgi:hypothetical protein